eukprot:PhF_6_TR33686/c0_g1_i2/m.49366/K18134/EOGT; protein O-GlcNAc transferase
MSGGGILGRRPILVVCLICCFLIVTANFALHPPGGSSDRHKARELQQQQNTISDVDIEKLRQSVRKAMNSILTHIPATPTTIRPTPIPTKVVLPTPKTTVTPPTTTLPPTPTPKQTEGKRGHVFSDASVDNKVVNHPGGTESEALEVRRKLSRQNLLVTSYREAVWTASGRPSVPKQMLAVQSELNSSYPHLIAAVESAGCSVTDWYCVSKYYNKAIGTYGRIPFCDKIYSHPFLEQLRAKSNTFELCRGGASLLECHNVLVPSHETETAACGATNALVVYDKMLDGDFPWLSFQTGAFSLQCRQNAEQKDHWQFMHSLADWMNLGFAEIRHESKRKCDITIDTPTMFVTRSGDYSPFAMTHDFLNTMIPLIVFGVDVNDLQVVIMDRMTVGFYTPIWKLLFSPKKEVLWFTDLREQFAGKKVCYKQAYFNIPARLSMLYNYHEECMKKDWFSGTLLTYRDLLLNSIGALRTTSIPDALTVTIINRKNYKTGHPIGRRIANIDKLASEIASLGESLQQDVYVNIVDYAAYDFDQQVNISRSTDLLVGMHGAGLIHIMYLHPHAAVFEFFCPEKPPSNYRYQYLSALMGLEYNSYNTDSNDGDVPVEKVLPVIEKQLRNTAKRKHARK